MIPPPIEARLFCWIGFMALVAGLTVWAIGGEAAALEAGILLFLGAMAAAFGVLFLDRLARDEVPRVESHWGGFGGGLGGWCVSASLAYLAGAVAFGTLLIAGTAVVLQAQGRSDGPKPGTERAGSTPTTVVARPGNSPAATTTTNTVP